MVTENGTSCNDRVSLDGRVHDATRVDMFKRYLIGMKRAMDEGVPVDGYYHWTLMDNFEWAEGYAPRFGLIHVDFATGKRTPKDSFYFYQQTIRENGENILNK